MGMRTAPYIAQRVSNALAFIHTQLGYFLLNYVDDFIGAEEKESIWQAYDFLTRLLRDLAVDTSPDKIVPPTTRLEFLGITFDTDSMTMEIPEDKVKEVIQETQQWLIKTTATRKEVESIIGKLQFMAKCVKPGRIFISRLINWLRGMDRNTSYTIPLGARKDIAWWGRFLPSYNGVSLIWLVREPTVDSVIATDTCLKGFGGTLSKGRKYFRGKFPQKWQGQNIALLELLAVMAALKLWSTQVTGLYFWIHVDNEAVATILNTGACRDEKMQDILREIAPNLQ